MMRPQADWHTIELLKDIAEALNEANDINSAMEAILPRLSEVLGLTTAWAFRFDEQKSAFVEVGASGLPPALACNDQAVLKQGWCECQDQFVEGRLNTAVNLVTCSRLRDAVGDKAGLVCHASIPLRSKGKPLGILNVALKGKSDFNEGSLALLGTIGHQVAVALDRAELLYLERKRTDSLEVLTKLSRELVGYVEESQLLQRAVEMFVEELNYDACGITLCSPTSTEPSSQVLLAAAHHGGHRTEQEYSYRNMEETELLDAEQRILLPDARNFIDLAIPHTEYRLRVESREPSAFSELDTFVVANFGLHLTAALENARLHQQSVSGAKWGERRRLAADLHDSVSQRLFSALLLVRTTNLLLEQAANDAGQVHETISKIETLIRQSQEEMRSLIETLRPSEERGFSARLRERIEPLHAQASVRIHLHLTQVIDKCLNRHETDVLLKVMDEALQNALKHASARNIYITVTMSDGSVYATIKDDGRGFDVSTVTKGLGSSTMRERMCELGGQLKVQSALGFGTAVVCELPISREVKVE